MNRLTTVSAGIVILILFILFAGQLAAQIPDRIYWEDTTTIDLPDHRFPQAAASTRGLVVIAHKYEDAQAERGTAFISLASSPEGLTWRSHENALGPFAYAGAESPIASLLVQPDGTIYIAVAENTGASVGGQSGATGPSETAISIHRSTNQGNDFTQISTIRTGSTVTIAPRLYRNSQGELVLFASRDVGTAAAATAYLGIFYSVSTDGAEWTEFKPLVDGGVLRENYLPTLASFAGIDYVVFQTFKTGGAGGNPPSTYQLYMSQSGDGGRSWSEPRLLTDFPESFALGERTSWEFYDNQRPLLYSDGRRFFLVWERKAAGSRLRNIYLATLDRAGETGEIIRFESNRDSIGPQMTYARNNYYISWYEGEERDLTLRLAEGRIPESGALDWYYRQDAGADYLFMDDLGNSSAFAIPVSQDDSLHMIWENDIFANTELTSSSIVVRSPDMHVRSPLPRALNFSPGQRISQDLFSVAWTQPPDASGIAGYSYQFTRTPYGSPPRRVNKFANEARTVGESLSEDGNWYFQIIAEDYAGNWSPPANLAIVRDTTPPAIPVIVPPETDGNGYLLSNTVTFEWLPPPEDDTAGYTYTYSLLDPAGGEVVPEAVSPAEPPGTIITAVPETSFFNRDNGTWMFSVAAVDDVGNVSEPAMMIFRLNKYIPVTIISTVDAQRDEVGRTVFSITGRGFTAQGSIRRIILDRDGQEPYDYSFPLDGGFYTVVNDRLIRDFAVEDIDEGEYGLALDHPVRGIKWADRSLSFEPSGVVKFGDFTYTPPSGFTLIDLSRLSISINTLVTIIILAALFAALVVTVIVLRGVVVEGAQIQRDVENIVAGRLLTGQAYKKRIEEMRSRGLGLRIKFVLLITVLILIVVMMVAVSLGFYMIGSRQQTLAEGLQNRSSLLLESLSVGAATPIDESDLEAFGSLVRQVEAMKDATGVVITGRSAQEPLDQLHALWAASNPESLVEKLEGQVRIDYREKDAPEDAPRTFALIEKNELDSYRDRYDVLVSPFYGRSIYIDPLTDEEEALAASIDADLTQAVTPIEEELKQMQREQLVLESVSRGLTVTPQQIAYIRERFPEYQDEEARNRRLAQINADIVRFSQAITELRRDAGNVLRSVPDFDPENFDPGVEEYTFYRPVVGLRQVVDEGDPQDLEDDVVYFYRGMVRLTVSTTDIVEQIVSSRRTLITLTGIIALIAAVIGIAGALILATIIIIPINRLIRGLEVIRDTEDKEELESHVVDTRTRDELSGLAQTINEMTRGLVQAAKTNKALMLGKEIQKKFLPLKSSSTGTKQSIAKHENEYIEVFGYYEGADELSGDYFDYVDLQNGYYAFIKGDVSGHGAAASLIMIEVATLFTSYFRRYIGKKPNLNLTEIVYLINELLEERQFAGKFAALTLILLELKTGKAYHCQAGDTLMHIYDAEQQKVVVRELNESPATGMFSRDLIDLKNPYRQISFPVKRGDMLLLFTDGIEESRHILRRADYSVSSYEEFSDEVKARDKLAMEAGFKSIEPEETFEEFDSKRVKDVIEAAMHRETYKLERRMDLLITEPLVFDFNRLSGSMDEMVLALISVEKVFRIVPDPSATERDRIRVDRVIVDFLKLHFRQFQTYFRNSVEDSRDPEYVWFTHMKEDPQEDDLTILTVRRK